jgi:hypothetical protein
LYPFIVCMAPDRALSRFFPRHYRHDESPAIIGEMGPPLLDLLEAR